MTQYFCLPWSSSLYVLSPYPTNPIPGIKGQSQNYRFKISRRRFQKVIAFFSASSKRIEYILKITLISIIHPIFSNFFIIFRDEKKILIFEKINSRLLYFMESISIVLISFFLYFLLLLPLFFPNLSLYRIVCFSLTSLWHVYHYIVNRPDFVSPSRGP